MIALLLTLLVSNSVYGNSVDPTIPESFIHDIETISSKHRVRANRKETYKWQQHTSQFVIDVIGGAAGAVAEGAGKGKGKIASIGIKAGVNLIGNLSNEYWAGLRQIETDRTLALFAKDLDEAMVYKLSQDPKEVKAFVEKHWTSSETFQSLGAEEQRMLLDRSQKILGAEIKKGHLNILDAIAKSSNKITETLDKQVKAIAVISSAVHRNEKQLIGLNDKVDDLKEFMGNPNNRDLIAINGFNNLPPDQQAQLLIEGFDAGLPTEKMEDIVLLGKVYSETKKFAGTVSGITGSLEGLQSLGVKIDPKVIEVGKRAISASKHVTPLMDAFISGSAFGIFTGGIGIIGSLFGSFSNPAAERHRQVMETLSLIIGNQQTMHETQKQLATNQQIIYNEMLYSEAKINHLYRATQEGFQTIFNNTQFLIEMAFTEALKEVNLCQALVGNTVSQNLIDSCERGITNFLNYDVTQESVYKTSPYKKGQQIGDFYSDPLIYLAAQEVLANKNVPLKPRFFTKEKDSGRSLRISPSDHLINTKILSKVAASVLAYTRFKIGRDPHDLPLFMEQLEKTIQKVDIALAQQNLLSGQYIETFVCDGVFNSLHLNTLYKKHIHDQKLVTPRDVCQTKAIEGFVSVGDLPDDQKAMRIQKATTLFKASPYIAHNTTIRALTNILESADQTALYWYQGAFEVAHQEVENSDDPGDYFGWLKSKWDLNSSKRPLGSGYFFELGRSEEQPMPYVTPVVYSPQNRWECLQPDGLKAKVGGDFESNREQYQKLLDEIDQDKEKGLKLTNEIINEVSLPPLEPCFESKELTYSNRFGKIPKGFSWMVPGTGTYVPLPTPENLKLGKRKLTPGAKNLLALKRRLEDHLVQMEMIQAGEIQRFL